VNGAVARWRRVGVGIVALAATAGGVAAWTAGDGAAGPPSTAAGTAAAGEVDGAWVFQVKGCAGCHVGQVGRYPDLRHAADWAGERRPGMSAEAYLAESIRDPGAFAAPNGWAAEGGPTMPYLDVSDAEVDALVAYLLGD
jgi:mono/diheme cytochrome c family protein